MADSKHKQLDLSQPRYDQSSYRGRAFHFFAVTDPRNIFVSTKQLDEAGKLVKQYKFVARDRSTSLGVKIYCLLGKERHRLVQRRMSYGRRNDLPTLPFIRTRERRCSYWDACLLKFPVTWSSQDSCSPSTSTDLD